MTAPKPGSLARWLAWLDTSDCPCPYEWQSIGILYGVSMGKGWVRMSAVPGCPHHGTAAEAEYWRTRRA